MDCPKTRRDTEAAASGLPDDPLVEILSRVPAKSPCRFKCVSKAWRDLIADPLHCKKLPQALQGFFFMVELHICHGEGDCDDEPCACYGGDGEARGAVDSDEEELPRYGFVDVLQRSVRLVDFYVTELPGIKNTRLVHCCNGLLLFAVKCNWGASWSYVVCNPATKECVAVPRSVLEQNKIFYGSALTYLLVDPGAPCHFNLVQFSKEGYKKSLHVYSSKTQGWSRSKSDREKYYQLTVLDVEGNIQKIIPLPCQAGRESWTLFDYIGRSQGCLHYTNHEMDDEGFDGDGLLIWVLEDYERQQWVLKDTGQKLISYHMDSKEVRDLCTLEHGYECITPYVPCFSELLALENKQ
ncbi:F-box protein At2g23160-like [Miscanthus floridulus]|uniref:F-box protein At2g23160-like n=1 Tax=Miscanthus floridulus TaxID=154761 RepID=UPI003457DB2D